MIYILTHKIHQNPDVSDDFTYQILGVLSGSSWRALHVHTNTKLFQSADIRCLWDNLISLRFPSSQLFFIKLGRFMKIVFCFCSACSYTRPPDKQTCNSSVISSDGAFKQLITNISTSLQFSTIVVFLVVKLCSCTVLLYQTILHFTIVAVSVTVSQSWLVLHGSFVCEASWALRSWQGELYWRHEVWTGTYCWLTTR